MICKLQLYKASMQDDIANITLQKTVDILMPFLMPISQATFTLGRYPKWWKTYDTVVCVTVPVHMY